MSQSSATGEKGELLTADEVADLLRIHAATVRRWGAEGALEAIRLPGRAVRFRRSQVEAIIANGGPTEQAS